MAENVTATSLFHAAFLFPLVLSLVCLAAHQTLKSSNASSIFLPIAPVGQLPTWIRALAANRLSASGAEWAHTFAQLNSGTYNNQREIVDLRRFAAGRAPLPGCLTIVSQTPGDVMARDLTAQLIRDSYWAGCVRRGVGVEGGVPCASYSCWA